MKLIDKDVLVSEIIRQIKAIPKEEDDKRLKAVYGNEAFVLTNLLSFIDTLEVKEVDLEKALSDLDKDIKEFVITEEFERESETYGHYWTIAKHAFLLGLNEAQKGE